MIINYKINIILPISENFQINGDHFQNEHFVLFLSNKLKFYF